LRRIHALWKQGLETDHNLIVAVDMFCSPKDVSDTVREAIRQFHIKRGCCDGNPGPDCIQKAPEPKRGRQKEPDEFEGTD